MNHLGFWPRDFSHNYVAQPSANPTQGIYTCNAEGNQQSLPYLNINFELKLFQEYAPLSKFTYRN